MRDHRPDPEDVLARVQREEARAVHGRLKIWFGAAPGVGKTFAMLTATRRAARDGADVVVGLVETHGRAETEELLDGLEALPRRAVDYQGHTLTEFDLDAALARRPRILILDELAHTNAPGSRNDKRWRDARALLEAGIDVHTTLNVQHLESLNDVVAQVTGVRVRETVPDDVFDQADDVALVDLAPDALLERLRAGKVYVPESTSSALEGFFRPGNLQALRELALRRTAQWVDRGLREYRRQEGIGRAWPTSERVLVCIGPSPLSATLLRAAHRMTAAGRGELFAVHVQPPGAGGLAPADRVGVLHNLRIADSLGARTITLERADAANAIVEFARAHDVTRLVIGKTGRSRMRELLSGSFVNDVIRASGDIDVYVIRGSVPERGVPPDAGRVQRRGLAGSRGYLLAAANTATAGSLAWLAYEPPDTSVEVMLLLLGVLVTALAQGRGPSVAAALASALAFNFLFTEPRFSLAIHDPSAVVAFVAMLLVALITSSLVTRVREQASVALTRQRETAALFSMTRELADAVNTAEIARIAAVHVRDAAAAPVVIFLPRVGEPGEPLENAAQQGDAAWMTAMESAVARWSWMHGHAAGQGTGNLPGASGLYLPMRTRHGRAGVVAIRARSGAPGFAVDERVLLETLVDQIGLAIERVQLVAERQQALVEADGERLRNTLLSSLSHDLRTPLATICGAASNLVHAPPADPGRQRELAESILDESRRLDELIANVAFATRLDSGRIDLRQEWTSVDDVIASAVRRARPRLRSHRLAVQVAPDLPFIRADAVLLEQAMFNLLDNAARHTPVGTSVSIEASAGLGAVVMCVRDDGPGIDLDSKNRDGLGLGLSICRGIVRAHGGTATIESGADGRGTTVTLSLPVPEQQPPQPIEAEVEP